MLDPVRNLGLDPDGLTYFNLANSYISLNRLEEASAVITEVRAKQLNSRDLHLSSYQLAFLNNEAAGMQKQVGWAAGKPELRLMFALEANTNACFGRLKASRDSLRRRIG